MGGGLFHLGVGMQYVLIGWAGWIVWNLILVGLSAIILEPHQPCFNGFFILIPKWINQVLTDDEIKAVEAHERGHQHHLHVWKNLLRRLFFVTADHKTRFLQELQADDYAAAEGRGLALAAALRKLSNHPDDLLRSERLLQRLGI